MKQFSKIIMIVALGLGILGVVLSTMPSNHAAAAGAAPVNVVNTPLPVSGSVSAAQSGSWNVGITGMPTVNLGAGNSVGINGSIQVGNLATNPVFVSDVDNPARHPIQLNNACGIGATVISCSTVGQDVPGVDYTVASGMQLVIEDVSYDVALPTGQKVVFCFMDSRIGGQLAEVKFAPAFTATLSGIDHFISANHIRGYADPGTTVSFGCYRDSTLSGGSFRAQAFGYLVALP
jgi:hypothetical protein